MSAITAAANLTYRDYVIPGDPGSGDHVPVKSEIRAVFAIIDTALGSLGVNGAISVNAATLVLLEANLAFDADTLAVVYNDPVSANNGIYVKTGASGFGTWDLTDLALPSTFADDIAAVLAQLETLAAAVAASAASQAAAETAAGEATASADSAEAASTASQGFRDDAQTAALEADAARIASEEARDDTLIYAEMTGPFLFYATRADAEAALAGLSDGQQVQVWADVTRGDARTAYEVVSAALEFRAQFTTTGSLEQAFAQPRDFALYGEMATRAINTNLNGFPVPADIGQLFIGNVVASADAITIDSNIFPPGIAFRRYSGEPAAPTDAIDAGRQLGYLDFRVLFEGEFYNAGSFDMVIDGSGVTSTGCPPPTKFRWAVSDGVVAHVAMDLTCKGILELGAFDGEIYNGPGSLGTPRLFVNQAANDYAAILAARPATGPGYAMRLHTLGSTPSDYLVYGSSGAGVGSFRFSVRGNGDVYSATGYHVGTNRVIGPRGTAISDLAVTATSGTLPGAGGSVVIANAAAPTNAELLKYCVELETTLEALLARLRASTGHGLIA